MTRWSSGLEDRPAKGSVSGPVVGAAAVVTTVAMGAAIGGKAEVEDVANYVLSLSDSAHDSVKAVRGKAGAKNFKLDVEEAGVGATVGRIRHEIGSRQQGDFAGCGHVSDCLTCAGHFPSL